MDNILDCPKDNASRWSCSQEHNHTVKQWRWPIYIYEVSQKTGTIYCLNLTFAGKLNALHFNLFFCSLVRFIYSVRNVTTIHTLDRPLHNQILNQMTYI